MQDVTPSATVRGTVTDPAGARVPRARVVLVGPLSVVASAETSAAGEFQFDRVAPGRYEVRVAAEGFRSDPLAIVATAGEETRVAFDLHVSAFAESVVVSASQVEMPLARAADSVTVISSRDLQAAQVETVADALRLVPGLTVSRNGGRGAVTSLFPRGGESDYTLVMVDGIKANAFGGGYDFSTLSANQVERIEVVRGPESALFGADAIGAVVHVVTKRTGRPRVEGLVEGGSFGTARVGAGTWGSRGPWSWGASAERTASDGYTGVAPATGEQVSNDDFLSTNAGFSAGWRAAGGGDVRGSVRYVTGDRGYPGPYGSNPIGAYTAVDRLSRGVTGSIQAGGRWRQPFSAGGRTLRQTVSANYFDLTSDFTSAYGLSASASSRGTIRSQTDVDLTASLALSGGIEALRERATSTFITADETGPLPIRRSRGRPVRRGALPAAGADHVHGRRSRGAPGARRDTGQLRLLLAAAGAAGGRALVGEPAALGGLPPGGTARGRAGLDADSRRRRHGHPRPGRARDRVHRQPRPQAREEPERGGGRGPGAPSRAADRRRHGLLQPVRRPHRRRRPGAGGRQPLPHRQHLERRARRGPSCRRRSARDGA